MKIIVCLLLLLSLTTFCYAEVTDLDFQELGQQRNDVMDTMMQIERDMNTVFNCLFYLDMGIFPFEDDPETPEIEGEAMSDAQKISIKAKGVAAWQRLPASDFKTKAQQMYQDILP